MLEIANLCREGVFFLIESYLSCQNAMCNSTVYFDSAIVKLIGRLPHIWNF